MRINKAGMKEWMRKLHSLVGTTPFKMSDLPPEMNIPGMPRMAWNDCYLEKVKKCHEGSSAKWIWQINQQRMDRWL